MRSIQSDLTREPIAPMILKLTWPMVLGLLGMVVFNLTDIYFIGKLGVDELAAMGFTFPVVMFVNALASGIGLGTSSLMSRSIGSEIRIVLREYATEALLLGVLFVGIVVVIGQLTINPLFSLMGASDKVLSLIKDYMSVWYWGMLVLVVPIVGNNVIRATGDTFTPGMIMTFSAVLNIIVDPLLIFGYGPFPFLSIKGAAIATVISRGTGMILIICVLIKREKLLTVFLPVLKEVIRIWKKIFYIAVPASACILIPPFSMGIVTRIISKFGNEAVAAFGIVSRLELFFLILVNALGSVMIIYAGQNWGKGKVKRLLRGFNIVVLFALVWGLLLFFMVQMWAKPFASIFSESIDVINITTKYLLIITFSYGFQGILILGENVFIGVNNPLPAAGLTFLRVFGLYVPLAWLASLYLGLTGVFWSAFLTNILIGILTYIWLVRYLKMKEKSPME
ncbi:MAG: MATE family efflux transporter [Bacteroidales bacterium]|nr:MATE family efflux transporter [Bacteroidales bacterium]MBS3776646.1 MATE family efflux transporter [Bacteroidales bacterium]